MKKKVIVIGLACLTAGIGLAGCAGRGNQPETTTTAETTTMAETTTTTAAETTTTTKETTTTTTEAPTTTTTETLSTTAKAHPEDDRIMEYLRSYYRSHDTSSGVPHGDDYGHYVRYAIADFNADGKNELAVEYKTDSSDYNVTNIFICPVEKIDFDNFKTIDKSIGYNTLSNVKFLDNGVAYHSISQTEIDFYPDRDYLDAKEFFILSNDVLQKLNYNLDNLRDYEGNLHHSFIIEYYKENDSIYKMLDSGQEAFFEPVIKTQEQYNADKALLDSGNVLNIEVKDFTAENIGL